MRVSYGLCVALLCVACRGEGTGAEVAAAEEPAAATTRADGAEEAPGVHHEVTVEEPRPGAIELETLWSVPPTWVGRRVSGAANVTRVLSADAFQIGANGYELLVVQGDPAAAPPRVGSRVELIGTVQRRGQPAGGPVLDEETAALVEGRTHYLLVEAGGLTQATVAVN